MHMRVHNIHDPRLLLLISTLLAGCGDDGAGATEAATDTSTGTSTGAATTTTGDVPTTIPTTGDVPTTGPTASSTIEPTSDASTSTGPSTDTDATTTDASTTTGAPDTSSSDTGTSTGGGVCGDGVIEGDEACDDGPDNADDGACTTACVAATCGDQLVQAGVEGCDDGGESPMCDADCTLAECGDGTVNMVADEVCDDGGESDVCTSECTLSACGDGIVNASAQEECDDGNVVDGDGCSAVCLGEKVEIGSIVLGGTSFAEVQAALDAMAVDYTIQDQMFVPPDAGDVIILASDGGLEDDPDYNAHLNAGKHLLAIGGSSTVQYAAFIQKYFQTDNTSDWHQAEDCESDWNTGPAHLITATMPAMHEFIDQAVSYHMYHLAEVGQPATVQLLGRTCHAAPDNYVLAVRKYPGGGSMTVMALDLGQYSDATSQAQFVVPFLTGYFNWLEAGTP